MYNNILQFCQLYLNGAKNKIQQNLRINGNLFEWKIDSKHYVCMCVCVYVCVCVSKSSLNGLLSFSFRENKDKDVVLFYLMNNCHLFH